MNKLSVKFGLIVLEIKVNASATNSPSPHGRQNKNENGDFLKNSLYLTFNISTVKSRYNKLLEAGILCSL